MKTGKLHLSILFKVHQYDQAHQDISKEYLAVFDSGALFGRIYRCDSETAIVYGHWVSTSLEDSRVISAVCISDDFKRWTSYLCGSREY